MKTNKFLVSLALALYWLQSLFRPHREFLANDGALTVGVHAGARLSGFHDGAPITVRYLLAKQGNADNHYATITSTIDIPVAVCEDEPAATTDPVNFQHLLGADRTVRMVAAGAIAAGAFVVSNGDGKIKTLPATAGSYWCVGQAKTTAVNSGDLVEVAPTLMQLSVAQIT